MHGRTFNSLKIGAKVTVWGVRIDEGRTGWVKSKERVGGKNYIVVEFANLDVVRVEHVDVSIGGSPIQR